MRVLCLISMMSSACFLGAAMWQPSQWASVGPAPWKDTLRRACQLEMPTAPLELFSPIFEFFSSMFEFFTSMSGTVRWELSPLEECSVLGSPQVSGVLQGPNRQKRALKNTLATLFLAFPEPMDPSKGLEHLHCGLQGSAKSENIFLKQQNGDLKVRNPQPNWGHDGLHHSAWKWSQAC